MNKGKKEGRKVKVEVGEVVEVVKVVSSKGALYVILPYDYTHPLFENTPVLDNNLTITAIMTMVTIITMMNNISRNGK